MINAKTGRVNTPFAGKNHVLTLILEIRFHCACVNLDPDEAEDIDWVCPACEQSKYSFLFLMDASGTIIACKYSLSVLTCTREEKKRCSLISTHEKSVVQRYVGFLHFTLNITNFLNAKLKATNVMLFLPFFSFFLWLHDSHVFSPL